VGVASPVGHFGVLALALALMLAASGASAWRFFQEGGWFAWILLLAVLVLLPVLAGLAVWLTRRPNAGAWPLIVPAVTMMLLGSTGVWHGMRVVSAALAGHSIDASQKARIYAAGVSEVLTLNALGGVFATVLFSSAVGVLGARALARIEMRKLAGPAVAALAAGLVALAVTIAARLLWRPLGWGVPLGLLPAFTACVSATLCGVGLGGDGEGAERGCGAMGDLLLAAALSVGGVATAAVAGRTFAWIRGFGALAAESIDPSQRVRILAQLWSEAGQTAWAGWAYALPVVAATTAVVVAQAALLGPALARTWGTIAAAFASVALVWGVPMLQAERLAGSLAKMWEVSIPGDVELARIDDAGGVSAVDGPILFVGRDRIRHEGEDIGGPSDLDSDAGCRRVVDRFRGVAPTPVSLLAFDRSTPYSRMFCLASALAPTPGGSRAMRSLGYLSRSREESGLLVRPPAPTGSPIPAPFDKLAAAPGMLRAGVTRAREADGPDEPESPMGNVHVGKTIWTLQVRGKVETRPAEDRAELVRWLRESLPERAIGPAQE
jgi:hypothetical protein